MKPQFSGEDANSEIEKRMKRSKLHGFSYSIVVIQLHTVLLARDRLGTDHHTHKRVNNYSMAHHQSTYLGPLILVRKLPSMGLAS